MKLIKPLKPFRGLVKKNSIIMFICVLSIVPDSQATLKPDAYYMKLAIQLAKQNPKEPFAALIVDNNTGKIIAKGLNAVHLNPTFHGEMVTINNCAKDNKEVNWGNVTLYSTAEPCSMCQSAIAWAGISRVVYGTSSSYLKSNGWLDINIPASEVNDKAPFYKGALTSGILAKESNLLFKHNRSTLLR